MFRNEKLLIANIIMFILLIGVVFVGEKKWNKVHPVAASDTIKKEYEETEVKTVRLDHPSLYTKKFVKKKRTDFIRFHSMEDETEDVGNENEEELVEHDQAAEQFSDEQQPTNVSPNETGDVPSTDGWEQTHRNEHNSSGQTDTNSTANEPIDEERDHSEERVDHESEPVPESAPSDGEDRTSEQPDESNHE